MTKYASSRIKHRGFARVSRVKEAWDHLARWYRQARGKQAHPTSNGLDQESAFRAELYRCRTSARLKVPMLVHPGVVNNDIPTEAEVELAVQGLKGGRTGG